MDLLSEFLRHRGVVKQLRGGDGEALAWCPWHPDEAGGNPSLDINVELCLRPSAAINNHDPMEETLGRRAPG